MRSNYKRIGDYIKRNSERNIESRYSLLLGININKYFMPSVANIVGTDLSKYKVVKPNHFACNRMHVGRDYRLPIAHSKENEPFIVSPAYDVFEIIKPKELLSDYLMLWFSRAEFDRNSWFYTDTDVRGKLGWDSLCDMTLPVPSIETQHEIVNEYHTITNRIQLNEQLNQKLEETAQAVYKHWFVDFEFPDENGKPYKSSGGVMVYNEELDAEIPIGWMVTELKDLCINITKGTTPEKMSVVRTEDANITYLKGETINEFHHFETSKFSYIDEATHEKLLRSQLKENDICYSIAGSLDKFCKVDKEILPGNTNQAIAIIRVNEQIMPYSFIYGYFISQLQKEFYDFNVQQAVQANLSLTTIGSLPIIVATQEIMEKISLFMNKWISRRDLIVYEQRRLLELKGLLLSKMATVGSEEEIVT